MTDYVTCPLCGDDVEAPTTAAEQAAWLRDRADAMKRAADEIESGTRKPLALFDGPLD